MVFDSSRAVALFLPVFVWLCTTEALVKLPNNETIPAVIVFGDSIVDPGNNNNLITLIKGNFPPYGRDFEGGYPTGRFCNGKIPTDFIVEELGIKELLPAYNSPFLTVDDLLTGVSFASGGCGYDPLTAKLVSVLSLSDQLVLFQDYIGKLKVAIGEDRTKTLLSKSIVLVVAGSDDIANTYYAAGVRRLQYDIPRYTDFMVDSASSFFEELYGLGVRRIGVTSAPPLGCLPSQRTLGGGKQRDCAEDRSEAAELFNSKLESQLRTLSTRYPQARFAYMDIFGPLLDLILNPQKSGFEVVDKGCCGTGTIEVTVLCNQLSPHTCTDTPKYVFWDSYHPTERAYKIIIDEIIQQSVLMLL